MAQAVHRAAKRRTYSRQDRCRFGTNRTQSSTTRLLFLHYLGAELSLGEGMFPGQFGLLRGQPHHRSHLGFMFGFGLLTIWESDMRATTRKLGELFSAFSVALFRAFCAFPLCHRTSPFGDVLATIAKPAVYKAVFYLLIFSHPKAASTWCCKVSTSSIKTSCPAF